MTAYVTMTNNVIRYVGEGVQLAMNPATDAGYYGQPAHDIIIRNNVFERFDCRTDGPGLGIAMSRGKDPGWNVTIEHNTFYNARNFAGFDSSSTYQTVVKSGLVIRDNVFQYGDRGLMSSAGDNTTALNTYATGISVTNVGSGYTAAPTVTFVGGGYTTQATGTALLNGSVLRGIKITDRGAGYTSVPTIQLSGGGGSGAAATMDAGAILAGQLGDWTFTNNLIFGAGTPGTPFPAGNIVPSGASGTQDAIFFRDPAGELNGLLSTSIGHNAASDGTDCGVNVANLAAEFVPLDASLQGYWKFDEGTGTSVSDSSGNGKTGTLSSSSLWTASGQSYNAVALTGGTSGSMSASSFTTAGTFSFAAWVKPGTITANSYIASCGNSAFSLYVNSTGKLVATTSNGATVTDSTALTAGTWYMVGCTYDGAAKKLTLYKNGVSVGNHTTTGTIASGSTTLYLGGNGGSSSSFNGSIDEARYYNTDMSTLTFNAVTGMKQLYDNFGALVGAIGPGSYTAVTSTTTTLTAAYQVSHYTYKGAAASLIYTWSIYDGPAGVTFSPSNGTTTGNSCVATWPRAGVYVLQLDVTDPFGGRSTAIGHFINVIQVPTSVSVSPSSWSLAPGATKQFTNVNSGVDQWGNALTGSWTWAVASGGAGGTIDATTGLYYAPAAAGADKVNLKYNNTVVTTTSTDADVTVTGSTIASVTVAATDSSAGELWSNNGTYTFTRTGSTASALTVNYTMGGQATNGTDYSTLGPTVVIPAGSASTAITLTAIDDTLIEGAESAVLTVTSGTGYARGSSYSASVSIADSGDIPTVTISATTPGAYEAGPTSGVFTVYRSGPGPALTTSELAVRYNISGTGINTTDYDTLSHSVVIMPGQTSATITITPVDDAYMESTETVILTLASVSTYTVGSPSVGTVTITDNDTTPTVTISATTPSASETGPTNGLFTVTRNGSTSGAITVNYSISGSATNTSDYSTLGTTVVIPNGSASATVTISTINDTLIEGSETAVLTVTTGTGYVVGSPSIGTVTIADNDVPSVTISATTPSASEQGPVNGVFRVTRAGSGPALLTGALTVNYSKSGTATSGSDYSTLGTTVVIPNGTASATITVAVIDDTITESSETAILTVTTGTGYTVGSPSIGTVTIADNDSSLLANEDFNYTVGGGSYWQGGNGGTGWTNTWTVSSTTNTGIYSGSLSYSAGGATLANSGNSAWVWKGANGSRTLNYTLGQDDTSLWIGWLIRQHQDGGTATYTSHLQLSDDTNNRIRLGAYWTTSYSGDAFIGGTRYYMAASGVSPVDNQVDFLVYRLDFGHQAGNTSPDKVYLWVNPTPGTQPSDGSANSTWTLGTGIYFSFTNNTIKLVGANYYNRTTWDEVRFGSTYAAVAPVQGGGMAPRAALAQASSQQAMAFLAPNAVEQLLSGAGVPVAGLSGPIAKAATASSGRSAAKAFRTPVVVAQGDSPFDSLSASSLAGIKLVK